MTLSLQRFLIIPLLVSVTSLGLPFGVRAAVSENLVSSSWNLVGAVERSGGIFTLRETVRGNAYVFQDISVSNASDNRLLLISYTRAETVRGTSDVTGLPYLYGYAMNSRGHILSYLQSPSLRHAETAPGRWSVTSQIFTLPRGTTSVRLFLKQASRRGTQKDGRGASFFAPGVFVAESDRELASTLERYRRELPSAPVSPPTAPPTPSPSFDVIYDGYGRVELGPPILLSPKVSTHSLETHAALVTSRETYRGDYEATFRLTNLSQLRTNSSPNPWEVGWFVFGYKPDRTFKYVILKPEGYGVELGEFLAADGQNFLYTSNRGAQTFPVGQTYDVRLRVENNVITLFVNGTERMRYRVSTRDRLSTDGKIGFYSEDAAVRIENVSVRAL